jgi:hypothetical protein
LSRSATTGINHGAETCRAKSARMQSGPDFCVISGRFMGSSSAGLNQAVVVVRNIHTSQRRLVPVSLAQAASLFGQNQAPMAGLPSSSSPRGQRAPMGPPPSRRL